MIHQSIITGTKLPELTNPGTANDLLAGKQLIDQFGNPLTGTIATKTQSDLSVSGSSIIVPAGYYASQTSKSIATATQATPSISVSSSGLITASATQSAGYVSSGTKRATKQLTTQSGKTITPGRTQQTAVSSGRYTTGTIYVAGDTDLTAANIKKGVNIFGVTGTYEGASLTFKSYSLPNPTFTVSGTRVLYIRYTIPLSTAREIYNAKIAMAFGSGLVMSGNSGYPFVGYYGTFTIRGSLYGSEDTYGGCGVPGNSTELDWGGTVSAPLEYIQEDGYWEVRISQLNSGDAQDVIDIEKHNAIIYYWV